jgi:hypothetical protein
MCTSVVPKQYVLARAGCGWLPSALPPYHVAALGVVHRCYHGRSPSPDKCRQQGRLTNLPFPGTLLLLDCRTLSRACRRLRTRSWPARGQAIRMVSFLKHRRPALGSQHPTGSIGPACTNNMPCGAWQLATLQWPTSQVGDGEREKRAIPAAGFDDPTPRPPWGPPGATAEGRPELSPFWSAC